MMVLVMAAAWAATLLTTVGVALALPTPRAQDGPAVKGWAVVFWALAGGAATAVWVVVTDLATWALLPVVAWYALSAVLILRGLRSERPRPRPATPAPVQDGTW